MPINKTYLIFGGVAVAAAAIYYIRKEKTETTASGESEQKPVTYYSSQEESGIPLFGVGGGVGGGGGLPSMGFEGVTTANPPQSLQSETAEASQLGVASREKLEKELQRKREETPQGIRERQLRLTEEERKRIAERGPPPKTVAPRPTATARA
jgi:hypothetical protein